MSSLFLYHLLWQQKPVRKQKQTNLTGHTFYSFIFERVRANSGLRDTPTEKRKSGRRDQNLITWQHAPLVDNYAPIFKDVI